MKNVFAAMAVFVTVGAHAERPSMEWKCEGTGRNSMQCVVKNNGKLPAEICVEVIKVCKGGDHYAQLCSNRLQPGESEPKVISDFAPKVKLFERCMGVEFGDRVIK